MTEGERIKQIRKENRLTLEQFGDILGVTQTTISRIENGKRNLTEAMRKSICREFRVDPIWLETGEGDPYIDQSVELTGMLDNLLHNESKLANTLFKMFAQYTLEDWKDLERIVNKSTEYIKQLEAKEEPLGSEDE
ncbi:MAG: helix-turn-helix transcriptional regulator [Lachnospiraceae bacterium]|nr:helix-turn-helix transcriptional regulator [Lachnospiraceae bacterium]MDE7202591.1 helix-turn-helix transcriptional regulator [Lachnospiraceae bacterium]